MYQSVNFNVFLNAFANHGRENQFSYEAKRIIFDYIEDYERDTGEPVELDVVAICCDFIEDTAEQIIADCHFELDENSQDSVVLQVVDMLSYYTTICGYDEEKNIIVYHSF